MKRLLLKKLLSGAFRQFSEVSGFDSFLDEQRKFVNSIVQKRRNVFAHFEIGPGLEFVWTRKGGQYRLILCSPGNRGMEKVFELWSARSFPQFLQHNSIFVEHRPGTLWQDLWGESDYKEASQKEKTDSEKE
jgi:hypothetical protein